MPSYIDDQATQEILLIPDIHCPTALDIAISEEDLPIPLLNARIYYPLENGELPPQAGGFGLAAFTHGNELSGTAYLALMRNFTSRGLIAGSIHSDGNVGARGRKVRLLCLAEAMLEDNGILTDGGGPWIGSGVLSGDYIFGGHSTGGGGTYLAAKAVLDANLYPDHNLRGSLAFAPVLIEDQPSVQTDKDVFFLTIHGSGDGDTYGKGFAHYDTILPTVQDGVVVSAPRKALVWGYDFPHKEWGGVSVSLANPECAPTGKAIAMLDTYAGAFVDLAFYGQAADVFFPVDGGTPRISDAVARAPWPTFGEAKVFGTSSERVTSDLGYHSFLVDGFENADIDVSDSGLGTTITGMSVEESPNGAGALMDNFHLTRVGLAILTQAAPGEFASSVSWRLSCEALEALVESTTITFRFGIQRTVTNEGPCEAEAVELPEIRMFITTPSGRADVDVSAFSRIEPPDARLESGVICNALGAGAAPPCRAFGSMQATIRIPTDLFCEPGFTLDQATDIGIEFSSAEDGRAVIIDDVELKRIPGQPAVSCRCSP